ncbi:prolyl aminopeptidase [Vibrio ponticus]|uniref:Proline iminopeptidase n=2 Tax=Vibrio ponticus TaxID=265668 RepID=A0A3N3E059_9VIBR|nr:prolyl aminopeptidase [Vibrio ponticus]
MPAEAGETRHQIYVEECGNPNGIPVLFVHGGPGSGCNTNHRRFFNPSLYRIVLFDQRGCGRSKPYGCIDANTTQHLVQDIEYIRKQLNISDWILFGGSWGATLSLVYAKTYSHRVKALVLRGVFLARKEDILWVYGDQGAAKYFPEQWSALISSLGISKSQKPLSGFWNALFDNDSNRSIKHKKALCQWESCLVKLDSQLTEFDEHKLAQDLSKVIQLYYCINGCFLEGMPILESLGVLKQIPTYIVHGQYDMVCPPEQAWLLHQAMPHSVLNLVARSGHVADEPNILNSLIFLMDQLVESKFCADS